VLASRDKEKWLDGNECLTYAFELTPRDQEREVACLTTNLLRSTSQNHVNVSSSILIRSQQAKFAGINPIARPVFSLIGIATLSYRPYSSSNCRGRWKIRNLEEPSAIGFSHSMEEIE
jgi:hypothetical protein